MKWFLILLLSAVVSCAATTYTDFYCDASVSANNTNVNAGSTTGAPVYGPSVNGNWDGTSVFTPTDGSTPASTVSAGMWASVYLDAATVAVYIAQVTNVAAGANGAITLSQAAFAGTKPASGVNGRTIRVGGCWKGPFGSVGFPFGFAAPSATNNSTSMPWVNFKNAASYVITAAMTHNLSSGVVFAGYSSNPRDGGRATIDGGTSGASYVLLTVSASNTGIEDMIFANNGASAASQLVNSSGNRNYFYRCVFHDGRGTGLTMGSGSVIECEAYNCNQSSGPTLGGFSTTTSPLFLRCFAHNNNIIGFRNVGSAVLVECISSSNGGPGIQVNSTSATCWVLGCDLYGNSGAGIELQSDTQTIYVENCNFIANTAFGITNSGNLKAGGIVNCGFGSGTQANGGADIVGMSGLNVIGSVTYAANVTPWVDPANGDFRINLLAAKAAGRGGFTTTGTPSGTTGYPDIGAAQSASTNSSSGGSWTFSQ